MIKLIQGDCLNRLKELETNTIDSIVTDPPYELGFMGKSWDNTGIANNVEMWKECLRVLKPGGHLLAFSGTRTYHRMASAIEDAGFEVRNQLIWAFGSGFPKSLNLSKQLSKQTGIGLCTCKEHEPMIELEYENSNNKRDNISNGDNDGLGFVEQIQDKGTDGNALEKQTQDTDISSNNTIREKSELCELPEDNNEKEQGLEKVSEPILQSGVCESISENEGHRHSTLRSGVEKAQTTSEGEGQSVSDMSNETTDGIASPSLNTIQDGGKELNGELGGAVSQLPQQDRESNGEGNIKSENDRKIKEWGIDDRFICSECRKIKTDIGGTALKPAFEPICMARKPLSEKTIAENCLKWGTGGINIDESRVGTEERTNKGMSSLGVMHDDNWIPQDVENTVNGRFPANLIHDNSEEVRECFPEAKGASSQNNHSNGKIYRGQSLLESETKLEGHRDWYNDNGNASRFFKSIIYQAKSSKSERTNGGTISNSHPTIKPIALMEYLVIMVTPKGGTVLDPFMGSGTTGIACIKNGYSFIGIEKEEEYIKIAKARIYAKE